MIYFYYILTLIFAALTGFMIGGICGIKAQKREVEKMIHSGVLQHNYKLYEVKEIEDSESLCN